MGARPKICLTCTVHTIPSFWPILGPSRRTAGRISGAARKWLSQRLIAFVATRRVVGNLRNREARIAANRPLFFLVLVLIFVLILVFIILPAAIAASPGPPPRKEWQSTDFRKKRAEGPNQ